METIIMDNPKSEYEHNIDKIKTGECSIFNKNTEFSYDSDICPSESEDEENPNLMTDAVTTKLATSGITGVAAAAAIYSVKKKRCPHKFETNPVIRKRQKTRLLRKLQLTATEFSTRVGQQIAILLATPGTKYLYKVFGARPLQDILRRLESPVMEQLKTALAQQTPAQNVPDPPLFQLPSLVFDDIPTPLEKMTQQQLRAFIPLMLKYSSGKGKPGWGKASTRPPWWPEEVPWKNVRMDPRKPAEKEKKTWTSALREIVGNCYKYHRREDLLLPKFGDELEPMVLNKEKISSEESTVQSASSQTMEGVEMETTESEDIDMNSMVETNTWPSTHFLVQNDGMVYPVSVSGVITMTTPKAGINTMANITAAPGTMYQMMIQGSGDDPPQVLDDVTVFTSELMTVKDIKLEQTNISD